MSTLLDNILQRWREYRERRAERIRGTENMLGRLAAIIGTKGER